MKGRDLKYLLIVLAYVVLLVVYFTRVSHPAIPPSADLVVEYLDSDVKVYRFERSGDRCYVAVGKLHGYTVDMECAFDRDMWDSSCLDSE